MQLDAPRSIATLIVALWVFVAAPRAGAAVRPDVLPWPPDTVVAPATVTRMGAAAFFVQAPVPDAVFALMRGRSFDERGCIRRADLRYLRLLHADGHGRLRLGEMVCHRSVARQLVHIFRRLYEGGYPVERMVLIDRYGASDERSMRANNTSCFCYRPVAGSRRFSAHSRGLAVDVNPLYNPCVRRRGGRRVVQPATAGPYTRRTATFAYKIDRGDLCHTLFTQAGFAWGGAWRTVKDYQHFELARASK